MSLRSASRKPSFDLLEAESSGDGGSLFTLSDDNECINGRPNRRKRRSKTSKKKKAGSEPLIEFDDRFVLSENFSLCEMETEAEGSRVSGVSLVELRQRYVNSVNGEGDDASSCVESSASGKWRAGSKLETMESLDWKRVMAEDANLLGGCTNAYFCKVFTGGHRFTLTGE